MTPPSHAQDQEIARLQAEIHKLRKSYDDLIMRFDALEFDHVHLSQRYNWVIAGQLETWKANEKARAVVIREVP